MPLIMPQVDRRALARSPLAVVVFQVRFEQNLTVSDGDTGIAIHERLGGRDGAYPRIETQQQVATQVEISSAGLTQLLPPALPVRGWRMLSVDGAWVVSLMPNSVSLETSSYTTWTGDFQDRIRLILEATAQHVDPRIEERVGLRYVNRVIMPEASQPGDLVGAVSEGLLGPLADDFWMPAVVGYQQQVDLDVDGEVRCLLRHGLLTEDGGTTGGYLLDLDVYRQQPQRFDVENIVSLADRLNTAALALFQRSLTDDYLDRLREGDEP
jgi:uncharacterized protein (TIGR04255 family)